MHALMHCCKSAGSVWSVISVRQAQASSEVFPSDAVSASKSTDEPRTVVEAEAGDADAAGAVIAAPASSAEATEASNNRAAAKSAIRIERILIGVIGDSSLADVFAKEAIVNKCSERGSQ
jgi:hypothetical protein